MHGHRRIYWFAKKPLTRYQNAGTQAYHCVTQTGLFVEEEMDGESGGLPPEKFSEPHPLDQGCPNVLRRGPDFLL